MYQMIQKCSLIAVLEVFFKEPTNIHFIREIGRKINLAQTSVRNHVKELEKQGLIVGAKAKPFNGFIANRDNEKFIFYKQAHNFYSLYGMKEKIVSSLYPQAIIVFGSYSKGEDVEESDIDIIVVSKSKKEIDLRRFEKILKRRINITFIDSIKKLDKPIRINVLNGWIIYGGLDGKNI